MRWNSGSSLSDHNSRQAHESGQQGTAQPDTTSGAPLAQGRKYFPPLSLPNPFLYSVSPSSHPSSSLAHHPDDLPRGYQLHPIEHIRLARESTIASFSKCCVALSQVRTDGSIQPLLIPADARCSLTMASVRVSPNIPATHRDVNHLGDACCNRIFATATLQMSARPPCQTE